MNIITILLGIWQTMHAAIKNKWTPFAIACGVIAFTCLSMHAILPFGWEALPVGGPLLASSFLIAWALFWPMNCATWFGWIGMLFRLVGALFLSNLAWAAAAVWL